MSETLAGGEFGLGPGSDPSMAAIRHTERGNAVKQSLVSTAVFLPVIAWWPTVLWLFTFDPLDGTREFIKRNGEFTVNIALIAHGRPVLGVVHVPALAQTYAAAQGLGAWRQQGEDRQPLHTRRWPSRPVLFVSRSHHGRRADAALSRFPPHEQVSKGSSLKFCLIAEGSADGYPRLGPTSEWDTAAAQCVVEQAGGGVLALPTLTPLQYNQGDGLINPDFVVVGDRQAPWRQWLQQAGAAERRA